MNLLPITFAQPLVLLGLIALPVIWWLLRMTPPRPSLETFPPLRILSRVLKPEETPHRSPWWLTLLRLLLAAFLILALAQPIYNPRQALRGSGNALAVVIDNSWASAPDWDRRTATAARLIEEARSGSEPIVLALTAEPSNTDIGPFDAGTALDRLSAASPRPVPPDRPAIFSRVADLLRTMPGATVAILSDGLSGENDDAAFDELTRDAGDLIWITPGQLDAVGIIAAENRADSMAVTLIRPPEQSARRFTVSALDDQGRRIAEAESAFEPGETQTTVEFLQPFELRNDFSRIAVDNAGQAASVRLLDENSRRRRVGMISAAAGDQAQPLLSPLYYIRRALAPYADLVEAETQILADAIAQLIRQNPAVIIMADIGAIPDEARVQLIEWIERGGTLLRFAGPRLAAAGDDGELLPVRLRTGARALGGALSWTEPQPVAEFPPQSPFHDLEPPRDVFVQRQVLAEPTPDIADSTWASLADGTPLVSGTRRGEGMLALFHVPPEATWSDLPISGSFVAMLRRIVQLSQNQGGLEARQDGVPAALAPLRMIAADGTMTPPPPEAGPIVPMQAEMPVTIDNPPGLYGSEDGYIAHNLLHSGASLVPLAMPQTELPVARLHYAYDESRNLKGIMFTAAATLLTLDYLALFWLGGRFSARRARALRALGVFAGALLLSVGSHDPVHAQHDDSRPGDAEAVAAVSRTRIAYVVTGNPSIDSISRAGIAGLNRFLIQTTALEPGDPAGIDIATDELAFYPLIYWPLDPDAAIPEEASISRVDAYMQQGGTVLFDTRDQYSGDLVAGSGISPATLRLREILSQMNIPPLEPVPDNHVLTKAFYILNQFPGRYSGAPLWVEASLNTANEDNRPVRTGDGVSQILITAADLAGAWAIDASGAPLLPTVPPDPYQRILAYRVGVNIMMYMLTGNYKSDQVHVPILLDRLGQ